MKRKAVVLRGKEAKEMARRATAKRLAAEKLAQKKWGRSRCRDRDVDVGGIPVKHSLVHTDARSSPEAVELRTAALDFWVDRKIEDTDGGLYVGHRVLNSNDTAGLERWERLSLAALDYSAIVPFTDEPRGARRIQADREVLLAAVQMALDHFDDQIHCRKPRMHPLEYVKALRAALAQARKP